MRDGRRGYRHDVEVSCRIGGEVHLNHRAPEKLVEPGSTLRCHGEGITPLNLAQNLYDIGACDLENRPLAQIRQDVLREDPVDLRECALATRLPGQRLGLEFAPQLKDGFKGVRGRSGGRRAFLPTMNAQIDAFGDQIAGFIPPGASVPQTDFRIDAERNARYRSRELAGRWYLKEPCTSSPD